ADSVAGDGDDIARDAGRAVHIDAVAAGGVDGIVQHRDAAAGRDDLNAVAADIGHVVADDGRAEHRIDEDAVAAEAGHLVVGDRDAHQGPGAAIDEDAGAGTRARANDTVAG